MKKTDRAKSPGVALTDPNVTVPLTAEPNCPPACPVKDQPVEPCEETIRTLAYLKWEAAGYPPGDGVEFWLTAEREVCGTAK